MDDAPPLFLAGFFSASFSTCFLIVSNTFMFLSISTKFQQQEHRQRRQHLFLFQVVEFQLAPAGHPALPRDPSVGSCSASHLMLGLEMATSKSKRYNISCVITYDPLLLKTPNLGLTVPSPCISPPPRSQYPRSSPGSRWRWFCSPAWLPCPDLAHVSTHHIFYFYI